MKRFAALFLTIIMATSGFAADADPQAASTRTKKKSTATKTSSL